MDFLKPVGALGSSRGSSIASWGLSKIIPYSSTNFKQVTQKALTPVLGKNTAKKISTRVMGRFFGRMVPYVGWGLTAKDAWDNRREIGQFIGNAKAINEANKYNLMWHVH
jgi:hypothetical protein